MPAHRLFAGPQLVQAQRVLEQAIVQAVRRQLGETLQLVDRQGVDAPIQLARQVAKQPPQGGFVGRRAVRERQPRAAFVAVSVPCNVILPVNVIAQRDAAAKRCAVLMCQR